MKELKKKLIRFYFFSSAIIIGFIFVIAAVLLYDMRIKQVKGLVPANLERLTESMRQTELVSDYELAKMELLEESAIFVLADQNGYFHFDGAYCTKEDRQNLLTYIEQAEMKEGENITEQISGKNYQICFGKIPRYNVDVYWCRDLTGVEMQLRIQLVVFGIFYAAGLIVLYFISRFLAGKALQPVKENEERQMEFFHAASHELRSPIAVIRTNNSAAMADPQNAADYEEVIKRECQRMEQLVEELLLVSAGSLKTWNLKIQKEDADTLLIRVFEKYQPVMAQVQMPLNITLPEDVVRCMVDAYRFEQVMDILLNNVIQYACTNKGVELCLKENKKDVEFRIIDHGPGIPEEERKKVFERFYRADKGRKDKEHFGLGLSIAEELVQAQKGRIVIEDTKGGGTTFVLYFPKK